jgi:lipoyl(octanoyl) transferase
VEARTTGPRRSDSPLVIQRWELGTALVTYQRAWDEQRRLQSMRASGEGADTVLLLEHDRVYTAGKRTQPSERPQDGTPVVEVDRGGKITYHGPGQLVGYPVLRLPGHVYVVDHVRRMEEALIRTCSDVGLTAGRVPGRSGVWMPADRSTARPERKLAAIGVRVARGVTTHGFALNCDPDLSAYARIVPCGIHDAAVTSLSVELGSSVDVVTAATVLEPHLRDLFAWEDYVRSPDLTRADELSGSTSRVALQGTDPVAGAS